MKWGKRLLIICAAVAVLFCIFSTPVFAITEGDVQGAVGSQGKEAVAGNVFIWFLCAIAFLKISQKIDSFMSSLGINVGHTGGSLLAEAMIAARGVGIGKQILGGGGFGGGKGSAGANGSSGAGGANGTTGYMSGGLAGVVSRQVTKGAVQAATGQGSGGLGGRIYQSSVSRGGDFANNVTSTVARGNISNNATMTGARASMALSSYLGYGSQPGQAGQVGHPGASGASGHAGQDGFSGSVFGADVPSFSNVEIGGGRITGTETSTEYPSGVSFGMYSAEKYAAPDANSFSTVHAVDGSKWYKQYATGAVERSPYMAPDGSVAYSESIIQKLPSAPKRKDRL